MQRPVQLAHNVLGTFGFRADNNPIGAHEIVNGRPLAQELGVGYNVKIGVGTSLADNAFHLVTGPDGNRRFGNNNRISVHRGRDFASGIVDVA